MIEEIKKSQNRRKEINHKKINHYFIINAYRTQSSHIKTNAYVF